MYISLDALLRIGQIFLIVAGGIAIIYLALMFKHAITMLNSLTKTLDVLQKDLDKLEAPLQTVDQLSATVDELHASVKKTANTALTVMDDSLNNLKGKLQKKNTASTDTPLQQNEPAADFQPVEPVTVTEEVIVNTPEKAESTNNAPASAGKEGE